MVLGGTDRPLFQSRRPRKAARFIPGTIAGTFDTWWPHKKRPTYPAG